MDTGMLRKFEKAKMYSQERERMHVESLVVHFDGKNNPHRVEYRDGNWHCDCDFFVGNHRCSHTMALELVLQGMFEPAPVVA